MSELECPRCEDAKGLELAWKVMVSGNMHLGAYCISCGSWIKWLPQTSEWLSIAPEKPKKEAPDA